MHIIERNGRGERKRNLLTLVLCIFSDFVYKPAVMLALHQHCESPKLFAFHCVALAELILPHPQCTLKVRPCALLSIPSPLYFYVHSSYLLRHVALLVDKNRDFSGLKNLYTRIMQQKY